MRRYSPFKVTTDGVRTEYFGVRRETNYQPPKVQEDKVYERLPGPKDLHLDWARGWGPGLGSQTQISGRLRWLIHPTAQVLHLQQEGSLWLLRHHLSKLPVTQIDYDNYPYILSEEISNRSPNHNHFTEAELWYLVYGLTSSAHIFRAVGTKVGDVRPDNIFINECGQIRIANLCSWPSERTNYEKVIYDR